MGDSGATAHMTGTQATEGAPTYLERGDPAGRFAGYYPAWVDKMAGDSMVAAPYW